MPRRLPNFLPDDEPEKLLAATTRQRDRLMLLLMLYCGLRVSEMRKLQIPHLDFKRRSLWVRHGKGDKDRVVPLPRKLVGPLRAWVGARTAGYVFPSPRGDGSKPLSSRAVQRLMKRLAVAAGLPNALEPRRVRPHALRHSYATRLLRTGADIIEVRDLLGHGSVATTQIYLHSDSERLADAVDRLFAA